MNAIQIPCAAEVRWTVVSYRVSVYQACHGAPVQPGSTCDKCNASIKYVVKVKSTAGEVMEVGTDCAVTLQGGIELRDIRNAERAYQHALYLASPEYKARCEREGREAGERAARKAAAEVVHALALHGLRAIQASPNCSAFETDWAKCVERRIVEGGDWDVEEMDAETMVRISLAAFKASVGSSAHVGTVGGKVERKAVLAAFIPCETAYGRSYVNKFLTADGESLVWFSAAGDHNIDDLGKTFVIRGTVKAHKEYRGVPETALTRCKLARA